MSNQIQNNRKLNNSHNKENINFPNNYSEKKTIKNRQYTKTISNQSSAELNQNMNKELLFNEDHEYAKHLFNEKEKPNNNNILKNDISSNVDNKDNIYITINDIIGEKCQINLDILRLFFNNYDPSKTSRKTMGTIKSYGVNTYQGIVRNYNEDRVSIIINMNKPKNYNKKIWPKISFFGIYDGHGGEGCSEYLRDNLHKLICNNNEYFPDDIPKAIKLGFERAEKDFINNFALSEKQEIIDKSGSCAIIMLIIDKIIYIANVGDSRCVLSMENGKKYIEVTKDHKPNSPDELKRIKKFGGNIYQSETVITNVSNPNIDGKILIGPYRVLPGRLSVSRTIGDVEAKLEKFGGNPNVIISEPDIFFYDLKKNDIDFFILGCDGIFDQISSNEIIDCAWMVLNEKEHSLVKECKNIHNQSGLIVDLILKSSLERKSFDNVTCLFISLKELGMKFIEQNDKNDKNNFKHNIKNDKNNSYISPNLSPINQINDNPLKDENKSKNYEKINMMARRGEHSVKNTQYDYLNDNNRNERNTRNNNKYYISNHRFTNNNNRFQSFNTDYKLKSIRFTSNDIKNYNEDYSNNKSGYNNNNYSNSRLSNSRIQSNPLSYSKKNQSFTKVNNFSTNHENNNNYRHIKKTNINLVNYNTYSSSSSYNKDISEEIGKRNYGIEELNDATYINNNSLIYKPVTKYNYNHQSKIIDKKNYNYNRKNLSSANNNSISLSNINNNVNNFNKTNIHSNASSHRYLISNPEDKNSTYSLSLLNNNTNNNKRIHNENIPLRKNYLNLNQQYKYQSQIMNNNIYSSTSKQIETNHTRQKKNLSLNNGDNNNTYIDTHVINSNTFHNNSILSSNNNLIINKNSNNMFTSRMKRNTTSKIRQISMQNQVPNTSFRINHQINRGVTSNNSNLSTHDLQLNNNIYNNYDAQNLKSKLYREIGNNYTNYNYNSNKNSVGKYKNNNYLITEINNSKRDYVYKDNRDNNNSNINRGNKYNTKYSNVQHNRKRGDNISDNNYKISKNLRHNRIKKENNNDYINANENGDESKNTKYSGTKYYHHYY